MSNPNAVIADEWLAEGKGNEHAARLFLRYGGVNRGKGSVVREVVTLLLIDWLTSKGYVGDYKTSKAVFAMAVIAVNRKDASEPTN